MIGIMAERYGHLFVMKYRHRLENPIEQRRSKIILRINKDYVQEKIAAQNKPYPTNKDNFEAGEKYAQEPIYMTNNAHQILQ